MAEPFRIGVTRDFWKPDGSLDQAEFGLEALSQPGIEWAPLPGHAPELQPEWLRGLDGLLVLAARVSAESLRQADRLKILARFGVGYDNVDVPACSARGIAVTITPDGVRRPVAVAALTFLLALAGKVVTKDRLTRTGRWAEKRSHMGVGLTGRTLGILGLGNIGREVAKLAAPFDLRLVGHDPHVAPEQSAAAGIAWLPLEELLAQADFVVVCCALTPETHHLLDARRLALMRPTSYLINVARGPIIDQAALTAALQAGGIAGAGLDVFEVEPIDPADPLLSLDNVLLAPHALCWTDECFAAIGRSAVQSLLDVAAGKTPAYVVNRADLRR